MILYDHNLGAGMLRPGFKVFTFFEMFKKCFGTFWYGAILNSIFGFKINFLRQRKHSFLPLGIAFFDADTSEISLLPFC